MTPDKIRIAVAREMGWHHITPTLLSGIPLHGRGNFDAQEIPNYPASLDDCAEFEKMLTGWSDRYTYMNHLRTIVGRRCEKNKVGTALVSDFDCKTALAIECCEAYLRVKGKWPSE